MLNYDRFTVKNALKIIATSSFVTDFECTKYVFDRAYAPDPARCAYSAPQIPLAGLKRTLLLRGGKGKKSKDFDLAAYKA